MNQTKEVPQKGIWAGEFLHKGREGRKKMACLLTESSSVPQGELHV